jgi:small-conductance mechanosensitive channel
MNYKTWIPVEELQHLIDIELVTVLFLVYICAFIFYKIFLKTISAKRHTNLRGRFKSAPYYLFILLGLVIFEMSIRSSGEIEYSLVLRRMADYSLIFSLIIAYLAVVKLFQIGIYCYLFFANMSHGIPKLIANVLTFIFALVLLGSLSNVLFKVNIATLATTSAVFSIILGLAMQDTIGNLFAGLSLQIDKSMNIGDWIEITSDTKNWVGQVQEITWRATYLQGFSDDVYMIPNRVIAAAKVTFLSQEARSMRLNHMFRFSYNSDFETIKSTILEVVKSSEGISPEPIPRALVLESKESSVLVGVFYTISDYAKRYRVGDAVLIQTLKAFKEKHIEVQAQRIDIGKG